MQKLLCQEKSMPKLIPCHRFIWRRKSKFFVCLQTAVVPCDSPLGEISGTKQSWVIPYPQNTQDSSTLRRTFIFLLDSHFIPATGRYAAHFDKKAQDTENKDAETQCAASYKMGSQIPIQILPLPLWNLPPQAAYAPGTASLPTNTTAR